MTRFNEILSSSALRLSNTSPLPLCYNVLSLIFPFFFFFISLFISPHYYNLKLCHSPPCVFFGNFLSFLIIPTNVRSRPHPISSLSPLPVFSHAHSILPQNFGSFHLLLHIINHIITNKVTNINTTSPTNSNYPNTFDEKETTRNVYSFSFYIFPTLRITC